MQLSKSYELTDASAKLVHNVVRDRLGALKNWLASAVEVGDMVRAKKLVEEIRDYEFLFKTFNIEAIRENESLQPKRRDHD